MRINKLNASFGKLQNETLSFHDGLNVLYAPNESGKSTWCAFIRAMLYGVDSSERSRADFLPDKLRYAPWTGAPMAGSMELTANRCDITLRRSTTGKNAPMKSFTATYTGTAIPVEGMTGANAGELLTGVSKDVFRRSAFIGQGAVAVSGSPDLERRIGAIVTTGEEQTSFSEANERLRSWQRKRRYNRHGLLPELEARMDDTRRRMEDMSGSEQELRGLESELERVQLDCARLEAAVTESRKRQRRESLETLNAARTALSESAAAHDEALRALAEAREAQSSSAFADRTLQEVGTEVEADLARLAELKQSSRRKASPLWMLLCFVLAAAAAGAYAFFDNIALIIGAALFCAAALFFLFRFSKSRRAAQEADEARKRLLKKYRAASSAEVRAALERYRELCLASSQAKENELNTRAEYGALLEKQRQLEEETLADLDFSAGSSEAARLGRELTAARQKAERLSAKIANLGGRLAATGDPLVLASSLSFMQERYDALQGEYDAITLAVQTLGEADSEIQSRFSPELGKVAAGYMSLVTGGRYSDVLINRDFTALTRTVDDAVAREAGYLSTGTLDLMYLAVRLAVCELALPDGEPCPLIIDDALVNFDETRFNQALELLAQIAKKRQVILFTCREPKP